MATMQVSDLYAVRPICSLCCCAFPSPLPCYLLDCKHLFCYNCLQGLSQGNCFRCPLDGSAGLANQFEQQCVNTVETILATAANYSNPNSMQYLINVFTTLQAAFNFTSVPCRAYMKTGNCPNVGRYCFYDHTTNVLGSIPCPLGPGCQRITFCPYMHGVSVNLPPTPSAGGYIPQQPMPNFPPNGAGDRPPFQPQLQAPYYPGPPPGNFPQHVQPPFYPPPPGPRHHSAPHASPFQYHKLPKWYHRQAPGPATLVNLAPGDKHYKKIEVLFNYTSSQATLVKIERIQSKHLYMLFANKHEMLSQIEGRSLKMMHLFHGTRKYPPNAVYDSTTCLDPRFGHGAWGQGTYYARNSFYSVDRYGHKLPDGTQQIFCMLVIVGDTADMPHTQATEALVRPPLKQGTNSLFHSVKGSEGGSDIYVTYEPNMSYPDYLITFR